MVLGLAATAQSQVAVMALQVHRRPGSVSAISVLAPMTLVFAGLGAWLGALLGAACGVALAMWLRGTVAMLILQRGPHRAPLDVRGMLRLVACAMALGPLAWLAGWWISGALAAALYALCFAAALWWLRPLRLEEATLAGRALGKRFAWMGAWSGPR
jgi:hypothetical protein